MFGSGAVGGYFGARLAEAGNDVTFIARGSHLEAMHSSGLRISSPKGDALIDPVQATDDPSTVGSVDAVFVAVKTWQLPGVIQGIGPLIGRDTMVIPLLNGVEAAERLVEALGEAPVLKGLCRILSAIQEPGHIRHIGAEPSISFGELDSRPSERTAALLDVVRGAGIEASVPRDIDAALWEKFMFVVSLGGIGALTRAPVGQVRANPATRELLRAAMGEVIDVATARGVALAPDLVERSMGFVDGLPPHGSVSLQRDIAAGRPSELDAWNGAVVRLGEQSGVPTPVHGVIHAGLGLAEKRARQEIDFDVPGELPDPFRARFLTDTAARFRSVKELADRAVAQLTDDEYFRALDAGSNSVAVVVKHLAGNLRSRWRDFLTSDGEKPDRHRDTEFEADGDSRSALTRLWEEGWAILFRSIESLAPDDLDRSVLIRGEPHGVEQALSRSLSHAAYHVGQIVFLSKHLRAGEWETLSIPRGQSEAWNRDMRARSG